MKKEDLRIVYMGTPDFAVEALRQLVEGGYNVVGVITMPDKPAGRGFADCGCFPYVTGSGVEYAAVGNFQSPCFFASSIPGGRSYQLGGN